MLIKTQRGMLTLKVGQVSYKTIDLEGKGVANFRRKKILTFDIWPKIPTISTALFHRKLSKVGRSSKKRCNKEVKVVSEYEVETSLYEVSFVPLITLESFAKLPIQFP